MRNASAYLLGAAAGAAAGAVALLLRARLMRTALRWRIRRQLNVHLRLANHAAAARSLGAEYAERLDVRKSTHLAARLRVLRLVQRRCLAALECTRSAVDGDLMLLLHWSDSHSNSRTRIMEGHDGRAAERQARADLAAEAQHAAALLGLRPTDHTARSPPSRHQMLAEEAMVLKALLNDKPLSGSSASIGCSMQAVQPRALQRAIALLRQLEGSLDFQARLLAEQMAATEATGYSRANFAYGSTPLGSWLRLFACTPLRALTGSQTRAAVDGRSHASLSDRRVRYTVLGSSIGWLALYGACVFGFQARGIELVSSSHLACIACPYRMCMSHACAMCACRMLIRGVHFACHVLFHIRQPSP